MSPIAKQQGGALVLLARCTELSVYGLHSHAMRSGGIELDFGVPLNQPAGCKLAGSASDEDFEEGNTMSSISKSIYASSSDSM
jgi:hypothetical protein